MPAVINFTEPLVRGDTLQAWYQEFTDENGAALDITSARVQLRDKAGTLVHEWVSTGGSPTITIAAGRCTMGEVANTVTQNWPPRFLSYDLELTLVSGETFTLTQGQLSVLADTTV